MAVAGAPTETELSETSRVFYRRYEEARQFGFSTDEARLFAVSHIYVDELRRLKRLGCDPETAARILF